MGNKALLLGKIFANPHLPGIDDYYEPFDFDYQTLHNTPADSKAQPIARPRSLITGQRMDKITKGPNWEDDLGGEFEKLAKDKNFENMQKAMYGQFENTFMMYLPRLCEHCLNPACVATCPSGAIYKREEDGIVLIDQDKCRGWRMCITGCPYKKSTSTGRAVSQRSAFSAIHVSKPVSRPCAPKPASVVSVTSAYCCMTRMRLKARQAPSMRKICTSVNWTCSSIRTIRLLLNRR
jgi:nitrate reductase beta subunit